MKHITLVSDDRVGLLADISYILGSARVNIESISAEVTGKTCMINISVKDEKKAIDLLRRNGFSIFESDLILVRLKDEPAQMAEITSKLSGEKVNILAIHNVAKESGNATIALKVDHIAKARRILAPYIVECEEQK